MSELEGRTGGRRRSDSRRVRGPARWLLLGIAIAFGIGLIIVLSLTQTAWGRSQILAYTLQTLGGRLNGELEVQRLEGNVMTGARLYDIALRDTSGVPLAVVDSAYVRYRLASFIGGDVVINRLDLFNADVDIFRLPGDTLWNYEEILEDPTPDPDPGTGATLIEDMTLHESIVTVRQPVQPDPRLSEAEQAAELEAILSDTARYVVEEVPGGHLQTTLITVEQAQIQELFTGPPDRGGTYLQVVDAVAEVRLWRDPPLEVRGAQAQVHLLEGILQFRAPQVVLPNTRGEAVGRIDLTGDRPLYDLVLESPQFSLADIRWLYPWLPEEPEQAVGSVRLRIQDRPEGLLVLARDLVLDMPGTAITGTFGLVTDPESMRFVEVDLEAEPLRIESVERLLPQDLPVEGLVVGGAVIRGES